MLHGRSVKLSSRRVCESKNSHWLIGAVQAEILESSRITRCRLQRSRLRGQQFRDRIVKTTQEPESEQVGDSRRRDEDRIVSKIAWRVHEAVILGEIFATICKDEGTR